MDIHTLTLVLHKIQLFIVQDGENSVARPLQARSVQYVLRGGVAFARCGPTVAPEPRADQVVVRKKTLEIFMGRAYVTHGYCLKD